MTKQFCDLCDVLLTADNSKIITHVDARLCEAAREPYKHAYATPQLRLTCSTTLQHGRDNEDKLNKQPNICRTCLHKQLIALAAFNQLTA